MRGPCPQPCPPRRRRPSHTGAVASLHLLVLMLAAAARTTAAQLDYQLLGADAAAPLLDAANPIAPPPFEPFASAAAAAADVPHGSGSPSPDAGPPPGTDLIAFGNTTSTALLDGVLVATGGTTAPSALRRARRPSGPRAPSDAAAAAAAQATPPPPGAGGRLNEGTSLRVLDNRFDACLSSPNGRFRLCLLRSAEIALYDGSTTYWAAKTAKKGRVPLELVMQADGNLVAYTGARFGTLGGGADRWGGRARGCVRCMCARARVRLACHSLSARGLSACLPVCLPSVCQQCPPVSGFLCLTLTHAATRAHPPVPTQLQAPAPSGAPTGRPTRAARAAPGPSPRTSRTTATS